MASSTRIDRDALRRTLESQLDVITRRQTLAVGLTRHALSHRLRAEGPWQIVLPGVYVAATGTPTGSQQQMAAMLYAGRGSVITGLTALRHHRIQGPDPALVDVLIPASRRRQDAAFAHLHRTTRMPKRFWQFGPLHYALPPRAVADAVRDLTSLREVRAIVASAIQRDKCTVSDLSEELKSGPGRGSALFREALSDVAAGIRSTAEGDLKDLLRKSGLPAPLFNAEVFAGNAFVARPDAWWPEFGVAVEVDSHEWHMSPEDHTRTLERQRRMAKYGIVVLPFTPKQIRTQKAEVLAVIRDALRAARGRPPANASLRTVPAAA
jgi:very-short-patch-repair endonuclease